IHRCEMRGEEDLRVQALLDLGGVTVIEEAVGDEVLVCAAERKLPATRAGDATRGVDDDSVALDQSSTKKWRERERRGGRIAAGRGDEGGGPQRVAVQLWQAVDELVEQLRRFVRLAVPLRVRGRVAQSEVGGQVDDVLHLGP